MTNVELVLICFTAVCDINSKSIETPRMLNDKRIQTEECAYSGKERATGKFKSMTESQMWLAKGRSKAQRTPECVSLCM